WRTCSSRALKLRQSEGTVKIALSFCTSSAYMGDLTSFLAVVVCVRSPFFRVKWLILPGQPVTPRKRYSIWPGDGARRPRPGAVRASRRPARAGARRAVAAERRRLARAFSGREAGNPGAHREQYGRAGRRERTGGMHRTGPEPTEGVSQRMERVLQGRRVRLRPLRKEDLPRRLEMINDPQVQELWIGVPADKNTLDDVEMWWY